jgi:hypothetical protein
MLYFPGFSLPKLYAPFVDAVVAPLEAPERVMVAAATPTLPEML